MNRNDKRHNSIRNKLFAAIAMLLVSSIMMVSTTYAWFTLSTAPEVQGITTTVGANGNLEIALSPADGNAAGITSGVGDSANPDWTEKNLTWGNLINLSDASYGLGAIKLLPARLNSIDSIGTTPLKTPVYGADGRIDKLEANTNIGQPVEEGNKTIYQVNPAYRGVRAVGTSSSMTKFQITFNNYLASMGQNIAAAQDLAEISLKNNGSKLAEMAIAHATAEGTDSTNYIAYKTNMADVIANLKASNAKVKAAIYDAVVVTAASQVDGNSEQKYDEFMLLVNSGNSLEDIMKAGGLMAEDGTVSGTDELSLAYNAWAAIEADLADAEAALGQIGDAEMDWDQASSVLNYLMNTTGIKLNGYSLSEFKVQAKRYMKAPTEADTFPNDTYTATNYQDAVVQYNAANTFMQPFFRGGATLQLDNGSGVYADIAVMAGNLSASVNVDIKYTPLNLNLLDFPITIKTTSDATGSDGLLGLARETLSHGQAFAPAGGTTTTGVLNETYGYIVDFMFRTNASNSNLLLQTDAAQRVYADGTSEATLGGGSTMTFSTGAIDGNAVEGLMECIRVVFVDTKSGDILGVAMLDMANATQKANAAGNMDITAKLYLHAYSTGANGDLVMGNKLTGNAASLCALPANTATAVSAMVFLDGDKVDNADVANAATSTTGTLNLQFASSEPLVPMENEALKNMAAE